MTVPMLPPYITASCHCELPPSSASALPIKIEPDLVKDKNQKLRIGLTFLIFGDIANAFASTPTP